MFTNPQRASFQRVGRNALIIIFVTLLILELFTRLVWWNDQVVRSLFGREITLLPAPLVNERQIESLKTWAADPNKYVQFDPVLGWSIRPNAQGQQDGVTYTSNSTGMRSLREYPLSKAAGILRIGTFGPSFTHSDDVADEATWQAQMERARPDLEVMNWGVGGYGTDQAFLRYQTQGAAYQPDVVLIGFEEDNIRRNVNRFRPFFRGQTDIPLTKPVFIEKGNELTLLENPFQTLEALEDTLLNSPQRFLDIVCPHDFYCQRDRYQSQPLDIFASYRFGRTLVYEMTQAGRPGVSSFQNPIIQRVNFLLIRQFAEEAIRNGSVPIVLIFPERSSIEAHERGEATPYAAGITLLREQGLQVIDLTPAFAHARQTDQRNYLDYYAYDGGHFSQLGNYVVSQTVLAHLCQQKILENCGDFLKQAPP
ncbi:MAG: hypothetical protein BroJett011_70220 [Chloroflexota bacterium]|nr:MAG: hypothetical protein BroJett011_70220 [Chloroflexota bacterium]